ncbi:hypothetical protein MMC31_002782, partial [Peltigera leucophlebia]|nr:hypothetical protein [Peltigera leucophlebia]
MALKRKRSISSTSPTTITSPSRFPDACARTASASPRSSVQFPNHDISISNHQSSAYPAYPSDDLPPQLHSRTRKRLRSRPDEASIHSTNSSTPGRIAAYTTQDRTYQKLFAAARSPPPAPPPPPTSATLASVQAPSRQSSLHAYWALPSPPSSAPRTPSKGRPIDNLSCQDCDSPLLSSDDVDICMGGMGDP